ncbi:MAG: signal peptidase II [Candidatus Zixiibacteriota bacterium]
MKTKQKAILTFSITTIVIILLDQVTKELALRRLPAGNTVRVIGDFFRLTLAKNPGGVFGTKIGGNALYILFSVIGIALISYYFRELFKSRNNFGVFSVGLLLGGAVGNLIDRIRFSEVTDFLDFGIGDLRWATFNIADAAILIGIILLFSVELKNVKKDGNNGPDGDREDEAGSFLGPGSSPPVEIEDTKTDSPKED